MAWLGLAGIGGHWWALVSAPPPLTPHFTPNLLKRPVWKRFGVKFGEKSFELPPNGGSVEPERPQQHPL
nr:hypothetical protein [Corynebacterium diphtheriae]